MNTSVFDSLYKKLNTEQRRAVDTIEGPVMVIAGPGTGKTSILTLRIANILRTTDTAPENILALTFTESGVHAMRKKLLDIIGTAAYKVTITTFHGFANSVIMQYPERFPRSIGSVAITDVDQTKIVEKCITEEDLDLLRPYGDPLHYVRGVLGQIKNLKREGVSPEKLEMYIQQSEKDFADNPDKIHSKGAHKGKMKGEWIDKEKQIHKNKELLLIYRAYEKSLRTQKMYDFEDMIIEFVKALSSDDDFRLILQETYQYILADEHQDANSAQNAILELLSNFHDTPNLFIVGDEKQAIFRFQGASLANFLYFKKLYPNAVVINLQTNYRSSQYILDASHSLIDHTAQGTERVRLQAHGKENNRMISVYEFSKYDYEHIFIAQDVARIIKEGTPSEDIAILYRNNGDAFAMAHALDRAGVEFRIESDQDILKHPDVEKLLTLFLLLGDLANSELWGKVLFNDFFGISSLDVYKILQTASHKRLPIYEVCRSKVLLEEARVSDPAQITTTHLKIQAWSQDARHTAFIDMFEKIIRDSGFLDSLMKGNDSLERLSVLDSFFIEVRKMAGVKKEYRLEDFLHYIELVREHGLLIKGSGSTSRKGVRLMTAHRSKGLEFDCVYIIGCYDGHWGNVTNRQQFHLDGLVGGTTGHIDDERRLFYVALTRAKKHITISYSKAGVDGREQLPTQFIEEIDGQFLERISPDVIKSHEDAIGLALLHHTKTARSSTENTSLKNSEYLFDIFINQGLSVTALNNYLKCAWEYFFVNLVRLPQAKSKHQMYGTAVHETLRTFFNKYKEDETMTKKDFLKLFEHNLSVQPISEKDFKDSLKKGNESLGGYYDTYKGSWNKALVTEFGVAGVHIPLTVNDTKINLLLKGQLDKIEILDGDNKVNVVDYKTGKPKTRNEIEGKTKNSDGNYKRQLTFYRILLENDERKRYVFASGELDFIEPTAKGEYKKERFEVTDEEVGELQETVVRVAHEIIRGEFAQHGCGEKDCEYCRLGKILTA
ncbi:MAG: ATP-dependent helicase [Candidatus Taylorbacteria bacterium]|nr:ATP-dependent helicase [Candidatus Taylorbacteria bacterium]